MVGQAGSALLAGVDEKLGGERERERMLILANEIFVVEILADVSSLESTFKIGNVCRVNLEHSSSNLSC